MSSRTFTLEATIAGHTFVILGKVLNAAGGVDSYFKEYKMQDESQEVFVERARKRAISEIARLGQREEDLAALTNRLTSLQEATAAACPTSSSASENSTTS